MTERKFTISPAAFALGLALVIAVLYAFKHDELQARPASSVLITEFQAVNHSTLRDEDGDFSDWIELRNFSSKPVQLQGWSLTDDFRQLQKWVFPYIAIGPGQHLLVFASAKDRRDPNRELHTNFKLQQKGQYLALVLADGQIVAHDYFPKYPPQAAGVSYGLRSSFSPVGKDVIARNEQTFFTTPTPRQVNADEVEGGTEPVQFSVLPGIQTRPVKLFLSSTTPGSKIYYTTNGDTPGANNGAVFRGGIEIGSTTTVRAVATREYFFPSAIGTASYIFPGSVAHQTGDGFPKAWGFKDGHEIPADYEVDRNVLKTPELEREFQKALRDLPSVSLVLSKKDLFDAETGIYSNPEESGQVWEKPASVEWFIPGQPAVQVDCGVRIQGGWNRRPEESPKHSFRLMFKKRYGTDRFENPLSASGLKLDTIILRAGCNNSWLHWDGRERHRGDYIRDQWVRETFAAMGQPSSEGSFVHLFVNGLYWGLYNPTERPAGAFLEKHLGKCSTGYDSRNGDKILEGDKEAWDKLMTLVNGGLNSPAKYQEVTGWLSLTNFADFMLLNYFAGNGDWDRTSNWYAARRREPHSPFHFFIWDAERTLENASTNTIAADDDQSPTRIFHKLAENAEFRLFFADRVQKHMVQRGPLHSKLAAAHFRNLAQSVDSAVLGESARWGDYRFNVHRYKTGPYDRYTREEFWRPEIKRILSDFFPKRDGELLKQLSAAHLYPALPPPSPRPSQQGLRLDASGAQIYYTVNGSDPRLQGGELNKAATLYTGQALPSGALVRARSRVQDEWSALAEF